MANPTDRNHDERLELLDSWVEVRTQIARLEAEASSLLAARMRLSSTYSAEHPFHRDAIHRSMIAEYSAAGRVTAGSMEYAFTDAAFLDADHSVVRTAFQNGSITAAHVREIVRAAVVVREAVRAGRAAADVLSLYDTAAIVIAEHETPARTGAQVRELAAALAGETVVERHRRARSERTVTVRPVGDGLALLQVVLPEYLVAAILDRLTQLARQVIATRRDREPADESRCDGEAIFGDGTFTTDPTCAQSNTHGGTGHSHGGSDAGSGSGSNSSADASAHASEDSGAAHDAGAGRDARTIDEVRADLLTDLLLASDPSAANGTGLDNIRARIQVTVAATTLAGLDDRPSQLDGHGPLLPEIACDLAGRNTGWSRLFLDPTGLVTETDTYTPTEPMRRFLRARDQHCRFPGCRMPVSRCQIDHTHDHAKGGRTEIHNLGHLCLSHHALKHPDVADDHRWTAHQQPGGTIDWFSPLGRTYRDEPRRRVMFV